MLTAATPGSCGRLFGLAGLLFMLLGSISAQPVTELVPKLADPKIEVVPGRPAPKEQTVALPPVVVSGDKHPWRYAKLPKFEILTRADNERTHELLLCYLRTWLVENAVIPREWLREPPIPYTIIIDDTDPQGSSPSVVAPVLTTTENYDMFGWSLKGWNYPRPGDGRVTPLQGWIHAADDDTTVFGANLYREVEMRSASTRLDRIDRCVPDLPKWMVAGLTGPFGLFEDGRNPVVMFIIWTSNEFTAPKDAAMFRGMRWISTDDTLRFTRILGADEIPFIPLKEFFSEKPPSPEQKALWDSQAGLIVRWGLLGNTGRPSPEQRAQFVKFVERQRSEAVTENMLIDCFGQGYAGMEKELKAYLRRTLGKEIQVKMENIPLRFTQEAGFSPATPEQVGRIIGDWQRMQGESLLKSQPTKAKEFLEASDRTLSRAWLRNSEWLPAPGTTDKKDLAGIIAASQVSAEGHPDPDFLAVCGLYQYDIGEYKLARDVLEIAATLHTKRTKAYLILAELRLREATAQPAGKNGALSVAQATYVLQVLKTALPSASSSRPWHLMVDTLARCESTPSAENLDMIIKGAAQFPRDSSLQLDTARLCLKAGEKERAMDVINKALPLVVDETLRREFQALRDSI